MTVLSPDTLTYGEDVSTDPGPEWPSLLVDFGGPARNAELSVKWSKRARPPSDLVHELRRACFLVESIPLGSTLLEIPSDLLVGTARDTIPPWLAPVAVVASPEQIDEVAKRLTGASNPILITEHGGRTDREREAPVKKSPHLFSISCSRGLGIREKLRQSEILAAGSGGLE